MSPEWRHTTLGRIATLQRGFDLPHRKRTRGDIPVVTSSGLGDTHGMAAVKGPGVVTGRYGTIGEVFYVEEDFWPLNTTLFVCDFHGNDPLFISYLLRTVDFQSHSGKSGVPGVNRNDIHELAVQVPSPDEQRRIASALSDINALLTGLDQLIAKKRDLKQAAMQQLLTGRLRLAGFSAPWNAAPLREVAFIRNDKALPTSLPPETLCIELEHIGQGTGQLVDASTAALSTSAKYRFLQGDVLFGRLRAYLRKHWLAGSAGVCSTEIWPLVGKHGRLASSYLSALVQTDTFSDAAAVSYGTHMPRADWSVIGALEFRLPPFEEQCAIGTAIRDMDTELAALEARRDKTRQLKQGMMQALLTGRIRLA